VKLIDVVKTLNDLASKSISFNLDYSSGISINYKFNNRAEFEEKFLGIPFVRLGKNDVQVDIRKYPGLYYNKEQFLKDCNINSLECDVAIIFYNEGYLFYESSSGKVVTNTKVSDEGRFLKNAIYYLRFREEFKNSKIVSYHSSAGREYVVLSPEKGKMLIGYPPVPPEFMPEYDLVDLFNKYQKINGSQEYQAFFKGHVIDVLVTYDKDQKFPEFIKNLEHLIDLSDRDYEVYISKFSFEKLKENFKKERNEYFSRVRGIISQLLSKVVSIPISISASALAVYNLKDDPGNAFVVVVAFIIYSYFTSFLLRLLHYDVFELQHDFDKEIEMVAKYSNIPKNDLNIETSKVFKRIDMLQFSFVLFQIVLAILSVTVLFVFSQLLSVSTKSLLLILASVLDVQLIISFWKLDKN
jgi:hypothetical protein